MPSMYLSPEEEARMERCRFQNLFSKFSWWKTPGGRIMVIVQLWHDWSEDNWLTDVDFLEYGKDEPVRITIDRLREIIRKGQLTNINDIVQPKTGNIGPD